eukprot:2820221-Rhodomonas_salina.1
MAQIFDRIEAELHGRRRLDVGTHWDQDLELQISEVLGQPRGDPNQQPWLRSGMPVVDLQHCTPLEYLLAHQGVPQQAFIAALSSRPI